MYRKFIYFSCAVIVLSLASYVLAQEPNAEIPTAGSPEPVIDGIKEEVWSLSDEHGLYNTTADSDPDSAADCSGSWWALWDSDYLYVFVDVNDEDLQNDSGESWQDDSIEFYVDSGNDKPTTYGEDDYQYRAAWNIEVPEIQEYHHGGRSLPGVEFMIVETDDGYSLEIKFPWTAFLIDEEAALGNLMGFDVHINDDDAGDSRDSQIAWFTTSGDAWQNPSLFGTVVLAASAYASGPNPRNGAEGTIEGLLQWTSGRNAATHNVYFGTNPTPGDDEFMGNQAETEYQYTGSLEPATTYYWRIDGVDADGVTIYTGSVWSFTTAPLTAHGPGPADDAPWVDLDTEISWSPGFTAASHDVYIGTDETAVTNADTSSEEFKGNQELTTFDAGPYEPRTTYYWRIDEVESDGVTKHTGEVWSFTLIHAGAGIKGEYFNNANVQGAPAYTVTEDLIDFDWGQEAPDPALGTDNFSVRWSTELEVPYSEIYTFITLLNTTDGVRLWVDGRLIIDSWPVGEVLEDRGSINLSAGSVSLVMEYYDTSGGAMAHLSWQSPSTPRQIIPRGYFSLPVRAAGARPPNDATEVRISPVLKWSAGDNAAQHDVYFGTDLDEVTNADITTPDIYRGRQELDDTSYIPAEVPLEWNNTYYWRIDEYNNDATITAGPVWSFTIGNFFIVDDFEDYNDYSPDRIFDVWTDGYNSTTNGSMAGYPEPDFAAGESFVETLIVHSGDQSMPLFYDNDMKYSEVERPISSGSDWTREGVEILSLWFRGYPASVGSFTEDPTGTYTMTASGADIWDMADEFHFAYKELTGPGSIVARVNSIEDTDVWAKAGVMIRNTLEPGSRHATTVVTPSSGVSFQRRLMTGGASTDTTTTGITAPQWVKIERSISGNFTASYSENGTSWTQIEDEIVNMNATVYIGLALTSHNTEATCEAVFSNVSFTGNVSQDQWMNQDIGIISNSAETMYVVLNDEAVVNYDGSDATLINEWTEWRINLQDFADLGIDLTDVESIGIGLGDRNNPQAGGSGVLYIDDIRLYLSEAAP
jgi:hypothetical protein